MALSPNINSREFDKFREGDRVAVTIEGDTGFLGGISYDEIQADFASGTVTNYEYYLASALVATVEVTYTDSTKSDISRIRRI